MGEKGMRRTDRGAPPPCPRALGRGASRETGREAGARWALPEREKREGERRERAASRKVAGQPCRGHFSPPLSVPTVPSRRRHPPVSCRTPVASLRLPRPSRTTNSLLRAAAVSPSPRPPPCNSCFASARGRPCHGACDPPSAGDAECEVRGAHLACVTSGSVA